MSGTSTSPRLLPLREATKLLQSGALLPGVPSSVIEVVLHESVIGRLERFERCSGSTNGALEPPIYSEQAFGILEPAASEPRSVELCTLNCRGAFSRGSHHLFSIPHLLFFLLALGVLWVVIFYGFVKCKIVIA
jgi:hypothetical protein